ncbi:hypothetical protein OROGR_001549 [Orobanche gracilis]
MAEASASLASSCSQFSPTSSEEKTGNNPLGRALTTSVSFGRFMSESLDWGKWSAFTHNRYLEEVEKYSKPGSVAEKKAYFETHFKRRRAAALLEQQNAAANNLPETNMEFNVKDTTSSDLDSDLGESYAVIKETKDGEVRINSPVIPVDQNDSYDSSIENEMVTLLPVLVESPVELATNHLENDERISDIAPAKEDMTCNKDDDSIKSNSVSSSEKKFEASSSKLLTNNFASSKYEPTMIPRQIRNKVKTQDSKRTDMESSNKRRSYTASLHMSINFASCSQKATSPGLPKIVSNSRLIRVPSKKYKNSMIPQTSTRASVNGIFKHHSAAPSAENRTVTPKGDSNSVRRTVDFKAQSPSPNWAKSSNTFEGKARLPTASSPFTFKSEERAAKRKEFFLKLEQKLKLKETERQELHQVKTRSTFKGLRNPVLSKAKENAEVPPRTELPCNLTKKIPSARPPFPEIEERASFKVNDTDSRPPWRLPAKSEVLKDVTGKNHHSSAKCSSKKINENASPNIWI